MDDSDDLFHDSFELNEDDLAILDQEEAKHAQQVIARTQQAQNQDHEPPPKKQKIAPEDEVDDIVDVFIQPNGLYGIGSTFQQQPKQLGDVSQGDEQPLQFLCEI
jgi:hypothetical protein